MSTNPGLPPARGPAPLEQALFALAFLATIALAQACSSGGPAPTPTPPPPLVSPVPGTVDIDLELADSLYIQGETDRALEIYYAAVSRGTPVQQQEAMWKTSRIQFEKGDNHAASQNARAFLGTGPDPESQRQALLLLGYSEAAQGRSDAAREAFEDYVETAASAVPYATLQLAELAARESDYARAEQLASEALTSDLPVPTRTTGLFALARYQDAADDQERALGTYRLLSQEADTASDRAEALWNLAAVAREMRDEAQEQAALHELVTSYPSHERALEALNGSVGVTANQRAYVLFRHRANEDAAAVYQSLVADPNPVTSGEAHYYLGILAERAGDPGQALNEYGAAIASLAGTSSSLLGDAFWDRGLVFETAGLLDDAAQHYASVADAVPGHSKAAEGLFRAGLIRYRQGSFGDAAAVWDRYRALASGEDAARAAYWQAKSAAALGDFFAQAQHLQDAVNAAPLAYHGLRARALLDQENLPADPAGIAAGEPDWVSIEAWLRARHGAEDTVAWESFTLGAPWQRGMELLGAALFSQASDEIAPLADSAPTPWIRYRIARTMYESGRIRLAARAAGPLPEGLVDAPPALYALVYPARFATQAGAAAAGERISPYLLLALVRQESFFDETAVSSAGALGLTQVVPATAEEIAADLEVADFKESDLLTPETSLRFGAHYLARQIEGFGGNLHAALAAYNGGPGNAGRWAEASAGDPDLLLESIDFPETRVYVEVVLANYALYRYTYGAAGHASLPLP